MKQLLALAGVSTAISGAEMSECARRCFSAVIF
jgi:hypothetical protein